jgi:hypothetical protein
MPNVDESLRDRVTRGRIHQLDVQVERNTLLIFNNVLADKFSGNV